MEAMQESDKYSEGVDVLLARSPRVEGFCACAAVASAVLVAVLPIAIELRAAALAWIGLFALAALRSARAARVVRIDLERMVEVEGVAGRVRDGSFVAPWLVVVRWRPERAWRDRSLLVAPDMLGADDFRRLRVLLRWAGG